MVVRDRHELDVADVRLAPADRAGDLETRAGRRQLAHDPAGDVQGVGEGDAITGAHATSPRLRILTTGMPSSRA